MRGKNWLAVLVRVVCLVILMAEPDTKEKPVRRHI